MTIKTKATAFATAAALALGTIAVSATPAAALGEKDRQALSIILGIGAAALILDGMNDNNKRRVQAAPSYYPRETWQERQRRDRERREAELRRERERRAAEARRERERDRFNRDRIFLPAQCVQKVKTRRGWGEVVSASCLDRRTERRLPANCAFTMKTGRNGVEKVYGSNCLEDQGIRLSRR